MDASHRLCQIAVALFTVYPVLATGGEAGNWAQYRGPNRDGISSETGLLTQWPATGPKVIWRVPIGEGYSSIAIDGDRIFTMAGEEEDEFALCLKTDNGEEVWRYRTDSKFSQSWGSGPRSTPTIDQGRVYVHSAKGKLFALDAASGQRLWKVDLRRRFGSEIPSHAYAASALVEGDLLLLPVGGREGEFMVAFDKREGGVVWTSHTDPLAYSSPIAVTIHGKRQILFLTTENLVSVAPADGRVYWTYPWSSPLNIAAPIFVPEDRVFVSTAYDVGAALVRVGATPNGLEVTEIWKSKVMKNWINSSVLHEGYLYGFDSSIFKCIDADTGEEKWKTRGFERGSLILADGHLIALGESGKLALVEATPDEYRGKASFQALEGKCWTQPTLLGGRLYLRNEQELVCLDVSQPGS